MQGGHCVILDQNNNRIKILNLTSSDLEKMDAVTFIEDYIENTLYPMQKTNGSKERTTSDPRQKLAFKTYGKRSLSYTSHSWKPQRRMNR